MLFTKEQLLNKVNFKQAVNDKFTYEFTSKVTDMYDADIADKIMYLAIEDATSDIRNKILNYIDVMSNDCFTINEDDLDTLCFESSDIFEDAEMQNYQSCIDVLQDFLDSLEKIQYDTIEDDTTDTFFK